MFRVPFAVSWEFVGQCACPHVPLFFLKNYSKIKLKILWKVRKKPLRKIILNFRTTEKRAAILENGKLVELFIEAASSESLVGNIYKGRVEKVVPGMQAAFVNIGLERNGFLQIDQINSYKHLQQTAKEKVSISSLLQEGQEIIVQVTKDSFGEKGPRLTTMLELPGRFIIYMPNEAQIAVSKKIEESERELWRHLGKDICEENEGVIFRTACAGKVPNVVQSEIEFLKKKWQDLLTNQSSQKPPFLLFNNSSLEDRLIRDVIDNQLTEVIVDDGLIYRLVKERLSLYDDSVLTQISHFINKEDIFSYYEIEQEMERALRPFVELENGVSLMIEQTEALTVIDVNTGKFTGRFDERETILKTNQMAAEEIARQIRLRNIGGMILVDFINMTREKDKELVKNRLAAALRRDRNYTKVFGFTQLGLLEMTRKKERKSLLEKLTTSCPICNEMGRVFSSEQVAFRMERALWEYKGMDDEAIWIEAPVSVVALWKANDHGKRLEEALGFKIFMTSPDNLINKFEVRHIGSESEVRLRISKEKESVF